MATKTVTLYYIWMGEEILFETHQVHESYDIKGYLERTEQTSTSNKRYVDIKDPCTRTEQMDHLKTLKLRFALGDTFPQ